MQDIISKALEDAGLAIEPRIVSAAARMVSKGHTMEAALADVGEHSEANEWKHAAETAAVLLVQLANRRIAVGYALLPPCENQGRVIAPGYPDPVSGEWNPERKCQGFGTYCYDPYLQDVEDVEVPTALCDVCHHELLMDI